LEIWKFEKPESGPNPILTMSSEFLCQPEVGYRVLHHYTDPFVNGSPIYTGDLGVFSSFTVAQAVAIQMLNRTVIQLSALGLRGTVCKDINLLLKGLITKIDADQKELPLCEFEILREAMWEKTWGPPMGGVEGVLLDANADQAGGSNMVVKLPPRLVRMPRYILHMHTYNKLSGAIFGTI